MAIKVETFTALEHWACYFINDDCSGLEDSDIALADKWLESIAPFYPVATVDDSTRFTWAAQLYGANCSGAYVVDYTCHAIGGGTQ